MNRNTIVRKFHLMVFLTLRGLIKQFRKFVPYSRNRLVITAQRSITTSYAVALLREWDERKNH